MVPGTSLGRVLGCSGQRLEHLSDVFLCLSFAKRCHPPCQHQKNNRHTLAYPFAIGSASARSVVDWGAQRLQSSPCWKHRGRRGRSARAYAGIGRDAHGAPAPSWRAASIDARICMWMFMAAFPWHHHVPDPPFFACQLIR